MMAAESACIASRVLLEMCRIEFAYMHIVRLCTVQPGGHKDGWLLPAACWDRRL